MNYNSLTMSLVLWVVVLSGCQQSSSQVKEYSTDQLTQIDQRNGQNLSKETTNAHRLQQRDSLRCEIVPEERALSFEEFCIRQQVPTPIKKSFKRRPTDFDGYVKIRLYNQLLKTMYVRSYDSLFCSTGYDQYIDGKESVVMGDFAHPSGVFGIKSNSYRDLYLIYPTKVDSFSFSIKFYNRPSYGSSPLKIKTLACVLIPGEEPKLTCEFHDRRRRKHK